MDEALHQRLKIAAVTQKRDMTELMEDAVREYLDRIRS
jgi:predicted transcriptional regulator